MYCKDNFDSLTSKQVTEQFSLMYGLIFGLNAEDKTIGIKLQHKMVQAQSFSIVSFTIRLSFLMTDAEGSVKSS